MNIRNEKWTSEMNSRNEYHTNSQHEHFKSDLQVNETLIYGNASSIMLTNTLFLITPEVFLLSLDDLMYLSFWLNLALFC